MKCIYWNTKNISEIDRVIEIATQENPDLIFLSETSIELLNVNSDQLDKIGYEYFPNPGCERVIILKRKVIDIELGLQTRYYTSLKITGINTHIISVHLPSQMFQHMDALKEFIRDFRTNIDSEIGSSLTERILIIGDFNVSPFDKAMIDFDGFVATNSINARSEITHLGKNRSTYYNPTWQLYSRNYFPGTKHFKRPSGSSYDVLEFHYLDQVVISQRLRQDMATDNIEIIENAESHSFFDKTKNMIEGSDHSPIMYEFKFL